MAEWTKPGGGKITLNDNPDTVAKAKSLGWTTGAQAMPVHPNPTPKPKKKRKKKTA